MFRDGYRKTDEKSFYTENERAFIQFVGPEDLMTKVQTYNRYNGWRHRI